MRYGHISEDLREYIIERPDTPTPWMNYISNSKGFCGIVSQAGGGFCFHKDPRERRLTKYRYSNIPVDRPGRYFYIEDLDSNKVWSPTWQPVQAPPDSYECRHGQGYTVISSKYSGIDHTVKFFVPADDNCEIWDLTLKNEGSGKRRFSIYNYCEFTFWSEPESRNIQWSHHLTRCSFKNDMVLYKFIEPHPAFDMEANAKYVGDRVGFAFLGWNADIRDFECARDSFIGTYRSESNPIGVENGKLSNSLLEGGIGCGALRTEIELVPGEEHRIIAIMGFADTTEEAVRLRTKFRTGSSVDSALADIQESWKAHLDLFACQIPDQQFATMVNVWNPYQCKTTFDWSRYISFYENGEGRGMGTRDSCQDTLAVSSHLPERVRYRIIEILSTTQFETGDCYHQFSPLGGKGDLKGFSDDHLWLIQMVHAYAAETGDLALLDESVKYADSQKQESVYDHLCTALKRTEQMKGPHGLPLILTADWNDTLHLWMECKDPESVLTAQFYVHALRLMTEMAERTNRENDAEEFNKKAEAMAGLINKICWDGEWYIRGFGSKVIGQSKAKYARLFLNTQSWALLSGVATSERAKVCMDSVKKHLSSDEGLKLIWPAFQEYDQAHGLISRYVPGRKENGIFSHANTWAIIAEVLLGRPENAMDYYKKVLPLAQNEHAERLKTEPYIFCQTVGSNDSLNKGEGANSWLTGTASWMYVASTQYILGVKPELDGLALRPCVPGSWKNFSVTRRWRDSKLNIAFNRTGKYQLKVNGKKIDKDMVPPQSRPEVDIQVEF